MHLRDASHRVPVSWGTAKAIFTPMISPDYVRQEYLPAELKGRRYYEPTTEGYEQEIKTRLENGVLGRIRVRTQKIF